MCASLPILRRLATAAMMACLVLPRPSSAAEASPAGMPDRIVSIGGAVTEILYALGEGARIAAVDTTSLYPPEAAAKPNVGYMRTLSAEGVLSLSPDLILMDNGAGPKEAVALIDAAGIPVRHVPTGYTVEDLGRKVREVAQAVGRGPEGEAMATRIETDLARLEGEVSALTPKRRILFILSVVDGRPNAAGRGTGADAVIRLAGAENVMADVQGYKELSAEALAALKPDVILIVDRPGQKSFDPLSVPTVAVTPAGQTGAVIRMDAGYLLGFGPRTPAALRELAAKLYPAEIAADVR